MLESHARRYPNNWFNFFPYWAAALSRCSTTIRSAPSKPSPRRSAWRSRRWPSRPRPRCATAACSRRSAKNVAKASTSTRSSARRPCRPTRRGCCWRRASAWTSRGGADGRFHLGKLGHVLLHDEMTRVNFDFGRDVCYAAAAHLDARVGEGRPAGLRHARAVADAVRRAVGPAGAGAQELVRVRPLLLRPGVSGGLRAPRRGAADAAARRRLQHRHGGRTLCLERMPSAATSAWSTCRSSSTARASSSPKRACAHRGALRIRSTCSIPARRCRQATSSIWMSQLLDCFAEDADRRCPAQGAGSASAGRAPLDPRAVLGPAALRGGGLQPAADLALLQLRRQRQQPDVRLGGVPRPAAAGRTGGDASERRRRELPHAARMPRRPRRSFGMTLPRRHRQAPSAIASGSPSPRYDEAATIRDAGRGGARARLAGHRDRRRLVRRDRRPPARPAADAAAPRREPGQGGEPAHARSATPWRTARRPW